MLKKTAHRPPADSKPAARRRQASKQEYHILEPAELERFLARRRAAPAFPLELNLAENLTEILRKANQFVPSSAGSILLDDPRSKGDSRQGNSLTFIAAFGEKSAGLLGERISAERGIAGHVYLEGEAYTTSHAAKDRFFYKGVDDETEYTTRSLVAVPIRIEHEVCGVLELINRQDAEDYSESECNLLEIFADYISVSIQNVLDGRQAQEIAKRDNLTGLYNDRYLHIGLTREIDRCRLDGEDLSVLFLDLDFFKRVNDSHGHLAGSQVLQEVGGLLRSLGLQQLIAARYGGDEFVLVAPGCSLDDAVDLAEEIRQQILEHSFCSEPGDLHPGPLNLRGLTCSVGIASLHRHIAEELPIEKIKATLLRLADSAMYVAKETGRNRTAVAGSPVRRRD